MPLSVREADNQELPLKEDTYSEHRLGEVAHMQLSGINLTN